VAWAALLVAGIVWSYRRMPVVCFGLCWFVITLLPMTGLLNLPASIAEHWLYVPSVGFYLAVCALGRRALERVAISPRLVFAACVLVTVSLTWRTILRNSDWLDPVRLYTVTKRAAPHSDRARNNLARELHNAGNSAQARAELLAAERIAPRDLRVKRNLAAIELAAGNLDAALAKTEECLRLAPNDVESQLRLAEIHEQRGDFASARYHYLAGMAGRQDISTRLRYGAFLLSHHRLSEAMQVAGEAYDLEPGNADVFNLIGAIETERGRAQTGRKAFEMACALDRHSPASFVNLARAALMAGDAASATGSLLRALRIQPENAKARYLLAIALWKQAERAAAERELCRAQQLAPGSSKIASALERLREGEPCGELASL
jgi:Flp pilus assembly protein TadD